MDVINYDIARDIILNVDQIMTNLSVYEVKKQMSLFYELKHNCCFFERI